jgi:hypothetical protein
MIANNGAAGSAAVAVRRSWSTVAVVMVLAAVSVAWAALPLSGGRAGTRFMVIVAVGSGVASVAQLLVGGGGELTETARGSLVKRTIDYVLTIIRGLPWAEVMVVAVMLLEFLHRSAPWHTGLLGVWLLGYLLAVHLAETRTRIGTLRAQLPLIAAGIGLAALAVGIAELPALPGGVLSPAIRVIAATVAVVAGGLGIPLWLGRQR